MIHSKHTTVKKVIYLNSLKMLQHKLSVCEIYFLFHCYFLHLSTRKNVTMDIQSVKNELTKQLCSMPAWRFKQFEFYFIFEEIQCKA